MKTEDQILIEKQLREGLSGEEKTAFLSKLANDEEFRQEYELEKQLYENLGEDDWNLIGNKNAGLVGEYAELFRSHEARELADLLKDIAERRKHRQMPIQSRKTWILYSGIAATVLLGLVIVLLLLQSPDTPAQLYAAFLDTSELPSLVERGNAADSLLVVAQTYFEQGRYKEALNTFDQATPADGGRTANVMLYQGIAQMETGRYADAARTFDKLIGSNSIDATKGYWYKALLLLKQEDTESAKQILEKISRENLYNKVKADLLLKEL